MEKLKINGVEIEKPKGLKALKITKPFLAIVGAGNELDLSKLTDEQIDELESNLRDFLFESDLVVDGLLQIDAQECLKVISFLMN